jgi:hypothetical protein
MANIRPRLLRGQAPKAIFKLTLVAEPRHGDDDGMRHLRNVLKLLPRGFGFRRTWIEYRPSRSPGPDDDHYARPFQPTAHRQEGAA